MENNKKLLDIIMSIPRAFAWIVKSTASSMVSLMWLYVGFYAVQTISGNVFELSSDFMTITYLGLLTYELYSRKHILSKRGY